MIKQDLITIEKRISGRGQRLVASVELSRGTTRFSVTDELNKLRGELAGHPLKLHSLRELEKTFKTPKKSNLVVAKSYDHSGTIGAADFQPVADLSQYDKAQATLWEEALLTEEMPFEVESYDHPLGAHQIANAEIHTGMAEAEPSNDLPQPSPFAAETETVPTFAKPDSTSRIPFPKSGKESIAQAFEEDFGRIVGARAPEPNPSVHQSTQKLPADGSKDDRYGVFDNISKGLNLENATTFDLGNMDIQKRFDEFDTAIENRKRYADMSTNQRTAENSNNPEILSDLEKTADISEIRSRAAQAFGSQGEAEKQPPAELESQHPGNLTDQRTALDGKESKKEQLKPKIESEEKPVGTDLKLDLRYQLPVIPQQEGLSAWATCCALLHIARDKIEYVPNQLITEAGPWKDFKGALEVDGSAAVKEWGLTLKPTESLSIASLAKLMDQHGPLLIAESVSDNHPRVVAGISGGGSDVDTNLHILDPWEKDMTSYRLPNKGAAYDLSFHEFDRWQKEQGAGERSGEIVIAYYEKN